MAPCVGALCCVTASRKVADSTNLAEFVSVCLPRPPTTFLFLHLSPVPLLYSVCVPLSVCLSQSLSVCLSLSLPACLCLSLLYNHMSMTRLKAPTNLLFLSLSLSRSLSVCLSLLAHHLYCPPFSLKPQPLLPFPLSLSCPLGKNGNNGRVHFFCRLNHKLKRPELSRGGGGGGVERERERPFLLIISMDEAICNVKSESLERKLESEMCLRLP